MKNQLFATTVATPAILFSILFLTQSQIALADTVTVDDDGGLQLSITANRRAQLIDEPLSVVTIISKQDIGKYQATRLEDVLRRVPGISIKNDGGAGKLTSIFLRGTNPSHVLVLIDGVKVGSATAGTTSFEHLPISQIERIEIVRGSRSSLYGTEAIGGVIHIITQKGRGKVKSEFTLGYGSNNTQTISASISGGSHGNWFRLSAGKEKTDGFNVQDSYPDYSTPYPYTQIVEGDDDGYDRNSFSLNVGHDFRGGSTVQLSVLDAKGATNYDGGFQNETDFHEGVISAKATINVNEKAEVRANIGYSLDDLDSFKNTVPTTVFTTKRNTASLLADIDLNQNHSLTIGTDWQDDKVSGSTSFLVDSRQNKAVFFAYQGVVANHRVEASLRNDNNEQFGNYTTGSVAVGRGFNNGMRLTASYATAFKAPTFNDLYYFNPLDPSYVANPNLEPESSKTFEVGLSSKQSARTNWGVRAFSTSIDDLIAYQFDPIAAVGTVKNISKVAIQGLELELGTKLADWNLNTSVTLLDAKNDSGFNEGKRLVYRPSQVASLDIGRQVGKLNLGATVHAESKRYTDSGNTSSLAGYATLDIRANYQASKNWVIGAKVGNVLDKNYQTNKDYNQNGLNGLLTVSYSSK